MTEERDGRKGPGNPGGTDPQSPGQGGQNPGRQTPGGQPGTPGRERNPEDETT
jgi:hypothetical protein